MSSTPPDPTAELDGILDRLVESYDGPESINNLETSALPNRRAVIEAFHHLQHLLFLGFFSVRRVDRSTLRLALAEHLLPARELLAEQIRRAADWSERGVAPEKRRPADWCRECAHNLLSALPDLRRQLYDDIMAAFKHDPAAESMEEVVFSYPGIIALTAHRIAHQMHEQGVPMIPRILSEYAHERTSIDIHPGARLGARLFIDHGTGVVIGATCEVGDDCQIYQGVTLGALRIGPDTARDREGRVKRHPTLEDRVTVYSGATILGGDTVVGEGSVIGGNVWVVKSVPPGSRVYRRAPQWEESR